MLATVLELIVDKPEQKGYHGVFWRHSVRAPSTNDETEIRREISEHYYYKNS